MIGLTNNMAFSLFVPQSNTGVLIAYIFGCLIVGALFLFALTAAPSRLRKPIVMGATFLAGLFYFLEFIIPGGAGLGAATGKLASVEHQLRVAQQSITGAQLHPDDAAKRIAIAKTAISAAETDLSGAQTIIAQAYDQAQKDAKAAYANADKWARDNKVQENLLDRDPRGNYIKDIKTDPATMRAETLGRALMAIGEIKPLVSSAKSISPTSSKDEFGVALGNLAGAESTIGGVRGGITSDNPLTAYKQPLAIVFNVIGAFAIGLGIFSLVSVHGKAISRRRPGWGNSLAFFVALIVMALAGFGQVYLGGNAKTLSSSVYRILFDGAISALSATMFSLVAFYIVSAAYRAFRVKSAESAVMMASAFIVMLAVVPLGVWITSGIGVHGWTSVFRIENIGHWILNYPNAAAQRGIEFGIGVGMLAMALRIWLSLERGSYFDKQM